MGPPTMNEGWDRYKHSCEINKKQADYGFDNIVEYLEETNEWRLQWEGVGPQIYYCPYCGVKLEGATKE